MRTLTTLFTLLSLCSALSACSSTINGRGGGDGGSSSNGAPAEVATGSGGNATTHASCLSSSNDYCSCDYSTTLVAAKTCNDTTVSAAVCCADVGWPDKNLTCTCKSYSCKLQNGSGSDSCQCSSYENGNLTECTDSVCCTSNDTDSCHCGAGISCSSFETQVTKCDASAARCTGSSSSRVSGCTG